MLTDYLEKIRPIHPCPIDTYELISEGMVNDVIVVNNDHIYRFPKHDWAFDDMRNEARVLALLRPHVDVPLPAWTVYDDQFVGYPLLQGEPLQNFHLVRMNEVELDGLAGQIGRFLRTMHDTPTDDTIQPSLTNRTRQHWLDFYDSVQKELFPHLFRHQQTWVHQWFKPMLADPDWMSYTPCLMNGDLSSYHLLVDPDTQRLSGIIDFGTAGIGDPACDFTCLLDQYGEDFVQRVGKTYGDFSHLLGRARWWAGTMELQWALGGIRNPDDLSWFTVHIGRGRGYRPIFI